MEEKRDQGRKEGDKWRRNEISGIGDKWRRNERSEIGDKWRRNERSENSQTMKWHIKKLCVLEYRKEIKKIKNFL